MNAIKKASFAPSTGYFCSVPIETSYLMFFSNIRNSHIIEEDKTREMNLIFRENQEEYIDGHGIKVVVGHYVGNDLKNVPNATNEIINTNFYKPKRDAGKNGNPVFVEPKDLIRSQQLYNINKFNLLVSDSIPLNRSLPDMRRKK